MRYLITILNILIKHYLYAKTKLYTYILSKGFKSFGQKTLIRPNKDLIIGKEYIEIGNNTILGRHIQLTAWESNNGLAFKPEIVIGSDCQIGSYNHITAINRIKIGDGVLTGKFVTITDNSHGNPAIDSCSDIPPSKRPIYSKGPVVIGDNVWIGDKVTILGNVTIGNGSIVGANAVVTKDVPSYCIVGGNPAHIIRKIK